MTLHIAALAAQHDRHNFDCGEPALNAFLQRQANQMNRKGFGKTCVALADDGVTVVGFVTVSAGQVQAVQLPEHHKLPRYPAPVLRVGRLAVDKRAQGRGLGQQLMAFALQLALDFSKQVGLYAVIVDAKHDKARLFYEGLGFSPSLDDLLCLFLPIAMLQRVHRDTPSSD
ncbi:MAG: GNAT family N-acetyltransferase [Rhodoferax sp.]|jgi:GNAT superfamily N-acetyltransferase|uniref:GNAT family N-acetyltransferase n=1 Tax=Rhodoferax sp. TaxID=50421 RepID=UPI001B5B5701|nr:GNAT family N-acetyltransferase [Rhodoferax sp.]MBP9148040.1 GNAT family N-acetyltransferase [Rhodoferax sp.]MBP9735966.1 GNAT family N-acetyltransferase [Rhodoferax sp.]